MPGNILSQLASTKGLFTGIELQPITQHGQTHDVGTSINQCHDLIFPGLRQLELDQFKSGQCRQRLNVNDNRLETCRIGNSNAVVNPLFL